MLLLEVELIDGALGTEHPGQDHGESQIFLAGVDVTAPPVAPFLTNGAQEGDSPPGDWAITYCTWEDFTGSRIGFDSLGDEKEGREEQQG